MNDTPLLPVIEFLRRHAPFDQMTAPHLEFLARRLKLAFYGRGEVIIGPAEGPADRFFIIQQGRVRGESGGESGGAWELTPGECFPVGALLGRRPVRLIQRAVEDTFCFELAREGFDRLLAQSPVFHDFCTRRLAALLDNALKGAQAGSANAVAEESLNTPLHALVRRPPVTCPPTAALRFALRLMEHERVGSIVVVEGERPVGIFTLHDILARIALGGQGLEQPIEGVMTRAPIALPSSAYAYEAARIMVQHGMGHLLIVDEGRLTGVVSERDLFSLQRVGLVSLSRSVARAESIEGLAELAQERYRLVEQVLAQGASMEQIQQIVTTLNDQITRRVIHLCEQELGRPSVPYTWLAFGSEGRLEQTLKTDQDNGILFQSPPGRSDEEVRQELLPLAQRINTALAQVGFPLCPGRVMASNPACCLSLQEWRRRFLAWIEEGGPQHLINAAIYFDLRPLHGPGEPVEELKGWLAQVPRDHRAFLKRLVENALRHRPPLGLVRDFVVEDDAEQPHSLDLKLKGITPFVDAARIFALAAGLQESGTVERLRAAGRKWQLEEATVEGWVQGFLFLQLLRLRRQQAAARAGHSMTNRVDPDQLNDLERRILKETFRQARKLQTKLETFFQF